MAAKNIICPLMYVAVLAATLSHFPLFHFFTVIVTVVYVGFGVVSLLMQYLEVEG